MKSADSGSGSVCIVNLPAVLFAEFPPDKDYVHAIF